MRILPKYYALNILDLKNGEIRNGYWLRIFFLGFSLIIFNKTAVRRHGLGLGINTCVSVLLKTYDIGKF